MMKIIRYSFFLSVCVLLWFTLSNISYNTYVSYSKKSLFNRIDSISPFGKYVSYETLEDRDETIKNMMIQSIYQKVSYVGQTSNNEYIYDLPHNMNIWIIRHSETTKDGKIKSGTISPIQILSKYQISSETEFYDILIEAFNLKLNQFDTYSKEKRQTEVSTIEIIRQSDFKVDTDLSIDFYEPYSSEYIEVGTAKVLVLENGGEFNYILKSKDKEKKLKRTIFLGVGIVFILLFIFLSRFATNLLNSKKSLGLGLIILLCSCGIVLALYQTHASSIKNRKRIYYMNQYETDVRRQYPPLEDIVGKVKYIKNLELEYVKSYFNPYYANESVTRVINALYASSYELRSLSVYCLQYTNLAVAQKGITVYKDEENTLRSRYIFQDIAWTADRLNDMSIFRIRSEFDLSKYEYECDSLSNRLNSLMGDFIDINRAVLKR